MKSQRGFTLVELSIVLIIIGLLVGGILKGQELVRNAQSKSLIAQLDAFRAASNGFVDKYGQYPGDFSRASALLAVKPDGVSPQIDGNGNGRVNGLGNDDESLEYWQHLAAADLISGINGVAPVPGVGIPVGRIPGSAWNAVNARTTGAELCLDCSLVGNYWRLGAPNESALTNQGLIAPNESYLLDIKIDDGSPVSGMIQAREGDGVADGGCLSGQEYATGTPASGGSFCVLGFVF